MRRRKPPRTMPPVALVGGEAVGRALRVVEFLLPRLHVHVGVGQLAEIDLRAGHVETAHRALDGHVAQHQRRQPLRREPIDRVHRDAVAVGVDELLVDPVAAALRQFVDVQLARGEHHLAGRAVDFIAIDVDVGKVVVGADFLNLTQRVLQRTPVPQPDVLQRRPDCWPRRRPRRSSQRETRAGRSGPIRRPAASVQCCGQCRVAREPVRSV